MESSLISAIPNFGVAGFAIYIMYQMYKSSDARMKEKDQVILEQVSKHEQTLLSHQSYLREVHQSTMTQLNHASRVIEDNIKAYERVINHLDKTS